MAIAVLRPLPPANATSAAGPSVTRRVTLCRFQPFVNRWGVDTVIGLSFPYDPELVAVLKDTLAQLRRPAFVAGGWLPDWRRWFVEDAAWDAVSEELAALGCSFRWQQ